MATNALSDLPAMIDALAANLTLMGINPERAIVHVGNGAFLRKRLWDKCLKPAESTRPTLTLLTTGGSMTGGSMNCLGTAGVFCDARHHQLHQTWSVELSRLLARALPGCSVKLQSVIRPANTISVLFREMHRVEAMQPDIAIEDFTINDVKGKVVIDCFRLINPQSMMMGQEPRQTTSTVGHLKKPSIQALIHALNRHYYSMVLDYRKNELEEQMLMNLHKTAWTDGLTTRRYEEHTAQNETTMKVRLPPASMSPLSPTGVPCPNHPAPSPRSSLPNSVP